MTTRELALDVDETGFVPVSRLDNVLVAGDPDWVTCEFLSNLDGKPIDDLDAFQRTMVARCKSKTYTTTDHLITHATVGQTHFLYVSLDNSCRANKENNSLNDRLSNICGIVNCALQCTDERTIVCFSEACRPSFVGDEKLETTDAIPWYGMRVYIEQVCGLHYLAEAKNNENRMSFGLAMFCKPQAKSMIKDIHYERLLQEGFGSVALGVQFYGYDEPILWGIHFPLDFNPDPVANKNLVTLRNLCKLLNKHKSCAIGDFNTIPGWIDENMQAMAKEHNCTWLNQDVCTFYGAHYDRVKPRANVEVVQLGSIH